MVLLVVVVLVVLSGVRYTQYNEGVLMCLVVHHPFSAMALLPHRSIPHSEQSPPPCSPSPPLHQRPRFLQLPHQVVVLPLLILVIAPASVNARANPNIPHHHKGVLTVGVAGSNDNGSRGIRP